ncbi:MAG: hypothetical protein MUC97_07525 [Bernardetiaceae bacterium]|jgi:hypothetical protein|nr:hypothetical protein [Bernardetiaceae bacterium]
MELVHENGFATLHYSPSLAMFNMVWHPASQHMEDIDFQNTMLAYVKGLRQFAPQFVLADMRQMGYVITPEMQDWANEEVNAVAVEMGVKKVAFVIAAELVPQLSVEQTVESLSATQVLAIEYFAEPGQAKAWLQGASVKTARALAA